LSTNARSPTNARIHPSALLGDEVELCSDVQIGPFCVLQGPLRIGPATRLIGHVTIFGNTEIGAGNVLHSNVVIGDEPQDLTYTGGPRAVRIGNHNVFREGVTVHRGSERGDTTIIGDNNLFMANAHVGHDCRVGNNVTMANGALLGGWAEIGDRVVISGNCAVHQYCRVGRLAMMSGLSRTSRDVPPFCILDFKNTLRGVNTIGMRRAPMTTAQIAAVRKAYATLFGTRQNLKLAIERLMRDGPSTPEVTEFVDFIRQSKRGVAFPGVKGQNEDADADE
jgi:UDP-N-acetylglucosamine acyltransferase